MKLLMVGLGRMGANMARRLMRGGHTVVAYDRNAKSVEALEHEGAQGAKSLDDALKKLPQPRIVWLMVPAGDPTEQAVVELGKKMSAGDVIIDGGNTFFKDDIRRARALKSAGVQYVDVGTSGGIWGVDRGYCLMVGGDRATVEHLTPILRTLSPGVGDVPRTPRRTPTSADEGFLHCGPVGAGHFVKMVHNGIEYGLMQAYAEGFDILAGAAQASLPEDQRYQLNVADIAELWRRGSVVGSWLLDLTAMALSESPQLEEYSGFVQDSGEGRWTVMTALEEAVSADVLSAALYARFRSRRDHTFAEKVLSAMRQKFGGHVERPTGG
jgi:6-phosphogluconate dehydrogenase